MHVSLCYLSHFFTENFGISFQQYLAKIRCDKARRQLLLTDHSLLTVSIECGFSDPKYFNRAFAAQYGMTPRAYRKHFSDEEEPLSFMRAVFFSSFHLFYAGPPFSRTDPPLSRMNGGKEVLFLGILTILFYFSFAFAILNTPNFTFDDLSRFGSNYPYHRL